MRTLLRTQHFNQFLNEITSTGTQINDILKSIPQAVPQQAAPPPPQQQAPAPSLPKFVNPNQPHPEEWPLGYPSWTNQGMPQVYNVAIPEPPSLADLDLKMDYDVDDDLLVADGFFPMVRNEKAEIDFSRIHEDEDLEIAEATYAPPEYLSDVLAAQQEKSSKPDLDDLFPGVGVNSLLERLEKVAGGEARPEDVFESVKPATAAVDVASSSAPTIASSAEIVDRPSTPTLCRSNKMISRAEGVYRRLGLMVE